MHYLPESIRKCIEDNFIGQWRITVTYDGQIMSMPWVPAPIIMFYNRSLKQADTLLKVAAELGIPMLRLDQAGLDPDSGQTLWAIDKKQTGKNAYRVKMQRNQMETDLIMFACRPTTFFSLLEPRSFRYMTKIDLLDARLESPPLRYWWSRIDTRSSILALLCFDEGTPFKFLLSDTVLSKKLIL